MEALMLASHMHHRSYGHHSHKRKLWRSLAMHKLCKLNSLGRAMLNHISSWRRRQWERGREICISLMEERSYALIHRVEMEVEVEKMMEEAIAKSLKAWGAPLHPSLHLRDEKWSLISAHFGLFVQNKWPCPHMGGQPKLWALFF